MDEAGGVQRFASTKRNSNHNHRRRLDQSRRRDADYDVDRSIGVYQHEICRRLPQRRQGVPGGQPRKIKGLRMPSQHRRDGNLHCRIVRKERQGRLAQRRVFRLKPF
jgi:hypothetical protein